MVDPSAIQYLEINGPDFTGRKFAVISNERVDTGSGILKSVVMPIPSMVLDMLGTDATFYLNGVSEYDPTTGIVTETTPPPIETKVYAESYTISDIAAVPEIMQGDIKVYAPGAPFGYSEVALLILQVRETGGVTARIGL